MPAQEWSKSIGSLPDVTRKARVVPFAFTTIVWMLWIASLGTLAVRTSVDGPWTLSGVFRVDGLTVLMWVVVTFFGGIVHSFSRRYMAGHDHVTRFFTRLFAFTLIVMVLVAADHAALFGAAWLAMGLVMADLIGHVRGWSQARAAGSVARRYFLASSALLGAALAILWSVTGEPTVSGMVLAVDDVSGAPFLLAVGALLLAAMIQSALVPFHTWLLSSMTAPTPASALMHAGFVNAGGILLTRFAPVVSLDPVVMHVVVLVGATSALLGKLLKSVASDVKRQLGCSTVGQMGFMIMQAGLGFFGAAITHLILHGFYKAYLFLSSGEAVEHTSPGESNKAASPPGTAGLVVIALSTIAGAGLFAALTGKGTALDSGLLLTLFVALTTLHATREAVRNATLPARVRFAAVPLVFLPSIAVYAAVYTAVSGILAGSPGVTEHLELSAVHAVVAGAFVLAYVAIETGLYRHSERLYVALLNATRPPSSTLLTSTEEYNEY